MITKQRMFSHKKSQNGRSMVEMLGVLAVIGVVTIAGITGMDYALQIHAENETVDAFTIAVTGARTEKNIMYLEEGIVKPSLIASVPEKDMYSEYFQTNTGAPVQVRVYNDENSDIYGYTVAIAGISSQVCEQIKYSKFNETCAQIAPVFSGCGDTKLADIDCSKFDEYKEDEGGRESALQLAEVLDLDYTTAASTYNSLIVFFGAMKAHVVPDNPPSDEPDDIDPYEGECIPNSPFEYYDEATETDVCCNSAGGIWSSSDVCCVKPTGNYSVPTGTTTVLENGAEVGVYEIQTGRSAGTRFFDSGSSAGISPIIECCAVGSSGSVLPYFIGTTQPVQMCCESNSSFRWEATTNTCCLNGVIGLDWLGRSTADCGVPPPPPSDCSDIVCPDNSNAATVVVGGSSACCCPDNKMDFETGQASAICCDNAGGTLGSNNVCCKTMGWGVPDSNGMCIK